MATLVLLIRLIIEIIKRKSITSTLRILVIISLSYLVLWGIFYFLRADKVVPLGTDICFDDWCVTITSIERRQTLGADGQVTNSRGQFVILHIIMSNQARRVAQKPSEPRIHILDENGNFWTFSPEGQQALEKLIGKQIPIDEKLEVHQSLETQLVFDVPKDKNLKALIEEGPLITKLLLNEDRDVYDIP
jgi:hypothetical protein